MRDLSIRHRLALGFGFFVALIGVVALLAAILVIRVDGLRRTIDEELLPQVAAANSLAVAVNHQRTGLRGYTTTGQQHFQDEFRQGIVRERSTLEVLKDKADSPSDASEVSRIESLLLQLHQDEAASMSLLSKQGKNAAFQYQQDTVRPLVQEIASISSKLASQALDRIKSSTDQTSRAMDRLYTGSLIGFIAALLLALLSTLAAGRSVTRPAKRIARAASAIAEGEYDTALSLEKRYAAKSYRDEMGQIAVALIRTAHALETREYDLRQLADELRVVNEQLETQNEELQTKDEEIQSQNEDLTAQSAELLKHNQDLEALTKDLMIRQSVTAVALSSLDRDVLLTRLLEAIMYPLDLGFGLIMLCDEGRKVLRSAVGRNNGQKIRMDHPPYEIRVGEGFAGQVAATKKYQCSQEVLEDDSVEAHIRQAGVRVLAGVPLTAANHLYGVALLGSFSQREFTDREVSLFQAFAERAVIAIQRSHTFDLVRKAEERERLGRQRLQAIIDNMPEGIVIAGLPDGQVVMANKAALALYGLESLPDSSVQERAATFNMGKPTAEPIAGEELPLSRSLLNGEVCIGEEVMIRWPTGREIVVLCNTMPLRDSEGNITEAVGIFQDITALKDQQHFLETIYESQRSIAETLQKSFLPSRKPIIEGYEIADAYLSAQQDAQIGGDFYDLIELGDGLLGVVMGDVSGKGVGAAVHTAMAKYVLRAFAHEDHQPARVLARVNDAIARYVKGEIFITLFYGVLDTAGKKLIYANGGHEQPILYKSESGECINLLSSGPAIGVIRGGTYEQYEIGLEEGDAFVLYTDGITEVRQNNEFFGHDGLRKLVAECGCERASDIADQILAHVIEYSENNLQDDVALLVIKSSDSGNMMQK